MTDKPSTIEVKTERIVCLDCQDLHLFSEVIETSATNACYWVRPLAIARSSPESFKLEFLYDLQDTAQLILPIELFRDALDTEILPLISEIFHGDREPDRSTNARKALHEFIANLYS
jgi:hypothetical protein